MKYIFNEESNSFQAEQFFQELSYVDYKTILTAIMFSQQKDYNNEMFDFIGDWNTDILDKNADVYYIILEGKITKLIAYKNESGLPAYIIDFGGKMMTTTPENGDILYSMKEEAQDALEKQKIKKIELE